jgi:di-N-acetylchitobiase
MLKINVLFFSLQMYNLISLLVFLAFLNFITSECPCSDISLCQPLQIGPRHEKLAFMVSNSNWRSYDYSQLTTIVICTNDFDPQLLCLAHSRQVRLVWIANYDVKQLGNATARTEWVNMQVDKVKQTFTDGLNLDMEDEIVDESDAAHQYTQLVQQLSDLIHVQVPGSMVRLFEIYHTVYYSI